MRGVALSHYDNDCTFETVLRRYELDDPVLWELAKVVHEADLDDETFDAPEAAGSTSSVEACRWCAMATRSWLTRPQREVAQNGT